MVKNILVFCLFIFLSPQAQSQGEANNWIFGLRDNLMVFTDTGVVAINAPPNQSNLTEFFFCGGPGNATISDKDGNLLFYTDGETLWNGNYDTISNPQIPLAGNYLGTNLFIPRPGFDDRYFVLTTSFPHMLWGLLISEIDLSLNNGLGGLVPLYNYQLSDDMVSKFAATYHANGKDIWVVGHDRYSNAFKAFLITEEGVYFANGMQTNVVPVISNIGLSQQELSPMPDAFNRNAWGRMKISPGGNYIAMSSNGLNAVEVFDFDIATGVVSNPRQITIARPRDVEFSSDGTLLYVGRHYNCYTFGCNITYPPSTHVHQFNLLAGDSAAFINSSTIVSQFSPACWGYDGNQLQLGPDMKVYSTISNCYQLDLCVINNPNQIGSASNWEINGIDVEMGYYGAGPNQGYPPFFTPYLDKNILFENRCFGDTTLIYTMTNTSMDSIRWEFSDPVQGLISIANQDSIYHVFPNPGSYMIGIKRYRGGNMDLLEKILYINPVIDISLPDDTMLCEGQPIILPYEYPYVDFAWVNDTNSDTVFSDTIVINNTGNWWPEVLNFDQYCGDIDTMFVNIQLDSLDLGNDVSNTCINNPVEIIANLDSSAYNWSNGDTTQGIVANSNGLYSVTVHQGYCYFTDSVQVYYDLPLVVSLPDTVFFCDSIFQYVSAGDFPADFLWSPTGETTAEILIDSVGFYSVTASNACGDFSDSTLAMLIDFPEVNLGNDTVICNGDIISLSNNSQGNFEPNTYLWSTGDSTNSVQVSLIGNYTLELSNVCGSASDTIFIDLDDPAQVELGNDTIICLGDDLLIVPVITGSGSLLWSSGETSNEILVSNNGLYTLSVTNSCGVFSDSINIAVHENLFAFLLDSINVDTNQTVTLDAGAGYLSYGWSTGNSTQMITVSAPNSYWVDVIDSIGCLGSDTIEVVRLGLSNLLMDEYVKIYPNPVNEILYIEFLFQPMEKISLEVFNELGQRVHLNDGIHIMKGEVFQLRCDQMKRGNYYLKIIIDHTIITYKFIMV
jgi:hypothetical protein